MPRFIVKTHGEIHQELRWRTGVVLRSQADDALALVTCDYAARRIAIHITGEHRRDYFLAVLHVLRQINNSFEKLDLTENVPLADEPKIAVPYTHLLLLVSKGIEGFIPQGALREHNPRKLLGMVQSEKTTKELLGEVHETVMELGKPKDSSILDTVSAKPSVLGFGVDLLEVYKQSRDWLKRRR